MKFTKDELQTILDACKDKLKNIKNGGDWVYHYIYNTEETLNDIINKIENNKQSNK